MLTSPRRVNFGCSRRTPRRPAETDFSAEAVLPLADRGEGFHGVEPVAWPRRLAAACAHGRASQRRKGLVSSSTPACASAPWRGPAARCRADFLARPCTCDAAGLDGGGEAQVALGVFVGAVHKSRRRQHGELASEACICAGCLRTGVRSRHRTAYRRRTRRRCRETWAIIGEVAAGMAGHGETSKSTSMPGTVMRSPPRQRMVDAGDVSAAGPNTGTGCGPAVPRCRRHGRRDGGWRGWRRGRSPLCARCCSTGAASPGSTTATWPSARSSQI
jgi:hypothetical protein